MIVRMGFVQIWMNWLKMIMAYVIIKALVWGIQWKKHLQFYSFSRRQGTNNYNLSSIISLFLVSVLVKMAWIHDLLFWPSPIDCDNRSHKYTSLLYTFQCVSIFLSLLWFWTEVLINTGLWFLCPHTWLCAYQNT